MIFEEKRSELEQALADLRLKRQNLAEKWEEARAEAAQAQQSLSSIQSVADPALQRRRDFEALATGAGPERLATLEHLVATLEEMKRREAEFKASCQDQLAALRASLRQAQQEAAEGAAFDEAADEDVRRVRGQIELEGERATKLKTTLAKKSRQLRAAERKLDEIPARAELDQYQKRFLELYDESAAVHR